MVCTKHIILLEGFSIYRFKQFIKSLGGSRIFPVLFVVPLLFCGCGDREADTYPELEYQVAEEGLHALSESDPAVALPKAERMAAAFPDNDFPAMAVSHEKTRHYLSEINHSLSQGDVESARRTLAEKLSGLGEHEFVEVNTPVLEGLQILKTYLAAKPYKDAESMGRAMDTLKPCRKYLAAGESFRIWYTSELQALEERRRIEYLETASLMAQELNYASASGYGDSEMMLAQVYLLLEKGRAMDGDTESDQQVFKKTVGPVVLFEQNLLNSISSSDVSSQVGCMDSILVAVTCAENGRRNEALDILELLNEVGVKAPSPELTEKVSFSLGFDKELFNAGSWRKPFPSITDYLNRISQIKQAWQQQ